MKIKFSTYGKPVVILPKDEAEKLLRRGMDDSRVDLILLNVMAGVYQGWGYGEAGSRRKRLTVLRIQDIIITQINGA